MIMRHKSSNFKTRVRAQNKEEEEEEEGGRNEGRKERRHVIRKQKIYVSLVYVSMYVYVVTNVQNPQRRK